MLRGPHSFVLMLVAGRVRVELGRCSHPGWGCSSGNGCTPTRIPHPRTDAQTTTGWYTDPLMCARHTTFGGVSLYDSGGGD